MLRAAGLLFFAFAGYARVATLGEEVRRPELIGRAVLVALAIVVVLYAVVGITLLTLLGPDGTASTAAPVLLAAEGLGPSWVGPMVRSGGSSQPRRAARPAGRHRADRAGDGSPW